MRLPYELREAIEAELSTVAHRELMRSTGELSSRYRSGPVLPGSALVQSKGDAAAYVAYRLPATFAAVGSVLKEVCDRRPDFHPTSVLDVGAGPGTVAWAASELWPELTRIVMLERDASMTALGRSMAARAGTPALRDATWMATELPAEASGELGDMDLTAAAYVVGEQPQEQQEEFVRRLWAGTRDVCVIVEPGTPRGSAAIRRATETLARVGATIIAPFPEDWVCVESDVDWCHFSARVPRTRLHRLVKGAQLAHEDEKFAYVVASRRPGVPIAARVLRHPQVRGGHIRLTVCTASGVRHIVVSKRDRDAYRRAKDLVWGSAIETGEAGLFGV